MLISFVVENYLSFNEATEFNMYTQDIRRLPGHVYRSSKIDLLKSAVIYGANGAGKSNLFLAVELLREIVEFGNVDVVPAHSYFKLAGNETGPITLNIKFLVGNVPFNYGIIFYEGIIIEEWLHILNFDKDQNNIVFERKLNKRGKETLKMSAKYSKTQRDKMLLKIYEDEVLESSVPFIHFAKEKKYKEITNAYNWLTRALIFIAPGIKLSVTKALVEDQELKDFTNEIINSFETGIEKIEVQTIDFDSYFGEENSLEKDRILKKIKLGGVERIDDMGTISMIENGRAVVKKTVTYHKNKKGKKIEFELYEESMGTLRLIDFIPVIYMLKNYTSTIFIDEIDQSIHPVLLKKFIEKIQSDTSNIGQLIFTTHESNLLDLDLFRQDEIWFAEKNKAGESHFYNLAKFNVRPDLDVRKGYLTGRFGAVPFLGNLKDLNWDKYEA